MEFRITSIPAVIVVKTSRLADERGYFFESYKACDFAAVGVNATFVQENQSFSIRAGTIRGLHFQRPPSPQAKLVRVLRGAVFDVAVDLRRGSPSYGRWIGERLTADGGEQMFIPRGFAHAFCTLTADTEVVYKVDGYYSPQCDQGIVWNDPTLAIEWPVAREAAVVSDRDSSLGSFADFASPFRYDGA